MLSRKFSLLQFKLGTEVHVPAPAATASGFRLRGRSFLLTYNWDFVQQTLSSHAPALLQLQRLLLPVRLA